MDALQYYKEAKSHLPHPLPFYNDSILFLHASHVILLYKHLWAVLKDMVIGK